MSAAARPSTDVLSLCGDPDADTPMYDVLGHVYDITAPTVDPASGTPLTIAFALDPSLFPPGDAAALGTVTLVRDGTPIPDCNGRALDATNPDDVCVSDRRLDATTGVGRILVASWHASTWVAARRTYTFTGFFSPVTAPEGSFNAVKPGAAVPLKFGLGGDQGLNVISSVTTRAIDCTSRAETGAAVAAATHALTYDATSGRYTLVWKTARTATGCLRVSLRLADGSPPRSALVHFAR